MATQRICDGCKIPLYKVGEDPSTNGGVGPATGRELLVQGERANNLRGGSPLPQGEFHWCDRCARIAFQAVQDAQLRTAGWRP